MSSPTYDPRGYLATLTVLRRRDSGAQWRRVMGGWPAETGYGHLRNARREGDGSTPTGVYGIETTIYGVHPRPTGLHYAYHRLVCGDWWDEDPFTRDYNEFVHVGCDVAPAFASWSEALWTETVAYPYFAVLRFNVDPIRGGAGAPGSGIFIHSWVGGLDGRMHRASPPPVTGPAAVAAPLARSGDRDRHGCGTCCAAGQRRRVSVHAAALARRAPCTSDSSLPYAASRGRYFIPQSGAATRRLAGAWSKARRIRCSTVSGVST